MKVQITDHTIRMKPIEGEYDFTDGAWSISGDIYMVDSIEEQKPEYRTVYCTKAPEGILLADDLEIKVKVHVYPGTTLSTAVDAVEPPTILSRRVSSP